MKNINNRAELTVPCQPLPRWAVGEIDGFCYDQGRPMAVFTEEGTGKVCLVPVEMVRYLSNRCPQTMTTRLVRDMEADEIIFKLFYNTIYVKEVPENERESLDDLVRSIKDEDSEAMLVMYKNYLVGGLIADKYVDEKTAEEIIHVKCVVSEAGVSCREEVENYLLRAYMNHYDNMKMFCVSNRKGAGRDILTCLPPVTKGGEYIKQTVAFTTENIILQSEKMMQSIIAGFLKDIYNRRRANTDYPESADPVLFDLLEGKDICGLEYILREPVPYVDSTIHKVRRKFGREGDRIRIVNVLDNGNPVIDVVGSWAGAEVNLADLKDAVTAGKHEEKPARAEKPAKRQTARGKKPSKSKEPMTLEEIEKIVDSIEFKDYH